jgi:ArsR family transcriptional regulator
MGPRLASTFIDTGAVVTELSVAQPVACCAPLGPELMSEGDAGATAAVFKALADPHRVRIVNLLTHSASAVCVCDITAHIGLSQPTTSWHLRKLSSAGLVQREQRGTWAYYSLRPGVLERLQEVFANTERVP